MPGMVLTFSRFNVLCNRLSSVVVGLCTAFFFLQCRAGQVSMVIVCGLCKTGCDMQDAEHAHDAAGAVTCFGGDANLAEIIQCA